MAKKEKEERQYFPKMAGTDLSNQVEEEIKEFLECLKNDITTGLAAFYMGNANKGTNDKTFMSNAKGQGSKASILGDKNSVYSLLSEIRDAFDMSKSSKKSPFKQMLDKLKTIEKSFAKDDSNVMREISILITGVDSEAIESLINLSKADFDENAKSVESLFSLLKPLSEIDGKKLKSSLNSLNEALPELKEIAENLGEIYDKIGEKFAKSVQVAAMADQTMMANEKIRETLSSCEDVAVDSSAKKKEVVEANITMKDMGSFMMSAMIVMSLGALFVMLGGGKFILAALKFGLVLAAFEALVLAPILIIKSVKSEVFDGLKNLAAFVTTCTVIMLIGALFMGLGGGKLVKNALLFGLTLAIFEALVIAPFLLFNQIDNEIFSGLKNFSAAVITCTVIMLVGALFMSLAGGKLVKNAIAFGLVLAAFEALIIMPFLIFNLINKEIFNGLKSFTATVITCTVILLVGSLFMMLGGGKMALAALEFTGLLMLFEAAVIAPFLLFNLVKPQVFSAIKDFTLFLAVAAGCLIVGSLFMTMKGGKMPLYAMEFTGVLALFIAAVGLATVPMMIWFNPAVMHAMKEFSLFIGICTLCLISGAWFVDKYGAMSVLKFTAILTGFVYAMIGISWDIVETFNYKNLVSLNDFAFFVGTLHAILVTGGIFVNKYGIGTSLVYGLVFLGFVGLMGVVAKHIVKEFDKKTLASCTQFSIFVGTLHAIILTGALFVNYFGVKSIGEYGLVFLAFTTTMGFAIAGISHAMDEVNKQSIIGFCMFIGSLHAILVTGALFVDQFGTKSILEYGLLMLGFTITMGLVIAGVSHLMDEVNKQTIIGFCILVGTLHLVLLTGTWFMENHDPEAAIKYALILSGFVLVMGVVFTTLSLMDEEVKKGALVSLAMAAGIFALGLAVSIVLTITEGQEDIIGRMSVLALITTEFGVIFGLAGTFASQVAMGALVMVAVAAGMAIFGFAVDLVMTMLKDNDDILGRMSVLCLIATEFGTLFALLGSIGSSAALGALIMVAVSAAVFLFGTTISYVCDLMQKYTGDVIADALLKIIAAAGSLSIFFGIIGIPIFAGLVALGSSAIFGMSIALQEFGVGMDIIGDIYKKHGDIMDKAIEFTSNAIDEIESIFKSLAFSFIAKSGAATGRILGVAVAVLMEGLLVLADVYKKTNKGNDILEAAVILSTTVTDYLVPLYKGINEIKTTLAVWQSLMMRMVAWNLDAVVESMIETTQKISKAGDITSKIDLIKNNIESYFSIPDQVTLGGPIGAAKLFFKVKILKNLSDDIGKVLGDVAEGVYKVASLQIPNQWDDKGNPTGYRQLKKKDFDLAKDNVKEVLTTMAHAMVDVYDILSDSGLINSGIVTFLTGDVGPIGRVLNISNQIATVVGNVGESIGKIAKLQIPIEFDPKTGKPINFRTLKKKDFEDMSVGVSTVLTSIIGALSTLYANGANLTDADGKPIDTGGKNIFDGAEGGWFSSDEPSPIEKVLGASFKVGELIANIGEGVGKIAKLQIPISWDPKTGKVTQYRTLKEKDFEDMGNGVSKILTSIFGALITLYNSPEAKDGDQNIFDEVSGGLFSSDDPAPIMTVLEASMKVSELVANIGTGISKIAGLQIPTKWDPKTGAAIDYERLSEDDLEKAGESVGTIVSTLITSLKQTYNDNKELFDDDIMKNVIESVQPISDLIANMADGLIKLASGQVPIAWDPKTGVAIKYEKITAEDYINAGITVGQIVTSLSRSLIQVARENPDLFFEGEMKNGKFVPDYSSSNEAFQSIVGSFSSMSGILTGIADAVIKLGQGMVADAWSEDGTPKHFRPIDFNAVIPQMKQIVEQILTSVAYTTIDIYKTNKDTVFSENSTFGEAVQAMNGTVQMLSQMADTVIKLGSARVPCAWDKDGKPTKFEKINIVETVSNAQFMFREILGSTLLTISQLTSGEMLYWDPETKIIWKMPNPLSPEWLQQIDDIKEVFDKVMGMVSKVADITLQVASMKIPKGFDENGNAKGYVKLGKDQIGEAHQNMVQMMGSLIAVYEDEKIKGFYTNNKETVLANVQNMEEQFNAITTSFSGILGEIDNLLQYEEELKKIFKHDSLYKGQVAKDINIGFFKDMVGLMTNVQEIVKLFNVSSGAEQEDDMGIFSSFENLKKKKDDMEKDLIKKSINNTLGIISDILTSVSKFDESILTNKNIANFMKKNELHEYVVVTLIKTILNIYKDILNSFNNDGSSSIFAAANPYENINKYIESISKGNEAIFKLVEMASILNGVSNVSFNNDIVAKIEQLKAFYSSLFQSLANLNISDSGKSNLYWVTSDLQRFISIISLFNTQNDIRANKLKSSINDIYEAMSNQKQSKIFAENSKILLSYVKTINSVNVNSTNALTALIKELNLLGLRLGNIDRLTDALANKLAEVLRHLVEKLEESKEAIDKADEIQSKRHQLINDSVEKISEMLGMPLQVNIKPDMPDPNDTTTPPST